MSILWETGLGSCIALAICIIGIIIAARKAER